MIILASTSEARQRLLRQAGVPFHAQSPDVDETAFKLNHSEITGHDLAQQIANAKALSLSTVDKACLVIGSDQTLDFNGVMLDKPKSIELARRQLKHLRNQTHNLHSAVAVARDNKIIFSHCETATLTMRDFSDSWLETYLTAAGSAILHCVGAYQIEGLGSNLFTQIQGNNFTIQGLPLLPLLAFLRDIGEIPA